jgi:hypothetical protein
MSLDKNYQGTDANLEISLEEYGFVARPVKVDYEDEYFVIYKMGDNQYGSGHIRESELDAIVNGTEWASKEDVDSMLETVGSSKEEWMDLPFESKFSDLVSYWGTENVIGTDYYPNDKKWAFKEIGLEYDSDDNDDLIEYVIPTHYATSLINADMSGLSDEDEQELDEFVNRVQEAHGNAHFMLGNDTEEYFSHSNDVNNLGSDVMKLYVRPSDSFAKGGGVRKSLFSNREYSYGRNWTNDHRHHNKRENYEVPMSNRKRKYADGGDVEQNLEVGNIVELSESGWDNESYHDFFNGVDDVKLVVTNVYKSTSEHQGFDSGVGMALYSLERLDDGKEVPFDLYDYELEYVSQGETFAKGGGVRKSLFGNREYSYGRNWTNDHRHHNKSENYEVPMSDRKRKYDDGGGVENSFDDEDIAVYMCETEFGDDWFDGDNYKNENVEAYYQAVHQYIKYLQNDLHLAENETPLYEGNLDNEDKKFIKKSLKESRYISKNNIFAKGGGVRKSLFSNREYSYGRNWTNDHRHHNKSENYEVPMSKRKRRYAEGGVVYMEYEMDFYGDAEDFDNDGYAMSEGAEVVNFQAENDEKAIEYATSNYSDIYSITNKKTKKVIYQDEDEDFAKGGGVRKVNGREYSYGRNWTNDHRHHNKRQNYEIPMSDRKRKYVDGGGVNEIKNYDNEDEVIEDALNYINNELNVNLNRDDFEKYMNFEDKVDFYKTKNNNPETFKKVQDVIQKLSEKLGDNFKGKDSLELEVRKDYFNVGSKMSVLMHIAHYTGRGNDRSTQNFFVFPKYPNKYNEVKGGLRFAEGGGVRTYNGREYSYGRNWTNDHRHHNKSEDYEVPMSNRKRKYAEGGLAEMNEDTNLGYTLYHSYDTLKEAQDVVDKWRKESPEFNTIVTKSNNEERPYNVLMTTGVNMGKRVYADGGGVDNFDWEKLTYKQKLSLVRESGLKDVVANKSVGVLTSNELSKLKNSVRLNKETKTGKFAKGGMVEMLNNIKETNTISEKEIKLINRRLNAGNVDSDTQELIDYIWDNTPVLTEEQGKKGYDYLMNVWKSPTGKTRVNNPFGYREQEVLENYSNFELAGFYKNRNSYIPIYNVIGNDTSFQYYLDGVVNIIGADGGMFAKGGGVRKKNGREYSYGRNWTNDHRHQNKREDYEVPMSNRKRKYGDGGEMDENLYENRKIESENNIYYLSQKKGVNFTIIERVGKLTDTYKGEASVQKNIDDITLDEIKELSFV